jgi:acetyl-CoA synthetase
MSATENRMSEYAWVPTAEAVEHANVTRLMRRHGIENIDELRRRSVADIDWFWNASILAPL